MNHRRLLVLAVVALVPPSLAVGIASATPSSGVTPTLHVAGADLPDDVNVNADRIRFRTKDDTEVTVVSLTVAPGGRTGWHSHPGLAVVSVVEGSGVLYASDCTSQTVPAGRAFVETGDDRPTDLRNESDGPLRLTVTFFAPHEEPVGRDEAAPDCVLG